jgi:hypothetical protein
VKLFIKNSARAVRSAVLKQIAPILVPSRRCFDILYLQRENNMTPSNYSPVDSSNNFKAISETILGDYYIQEYYKMLEYGIVSLCLCSILGLLAYIFSLSSIKDTEQLSEYECGFEPFDSATRLPFDIHFYIVGILFLIFDVEVAVLFP